MGFVVFKLTQYFLQRARKLAQIVVIKITPVLFFLAARQKTCSCTDRLRLPTPTHITRPPTTMPRAPKRRALTGCRRLTLVPCPHPPPLSSRLSRLSRRSEGTAASPHPSPSRRRRGKIPSIVVVLRSDDDASRRPPPPSMCGRGTAKVRALTSPPHHGLT